jgi:hypothetical protein
MKVIRDEDSGRLRAIGKRIAEGVNAESIGLLAFRGDGGPRFREAIEKAMRTGEGTTIWYLRVIHPPRPERRSLDARHQRRGMGRSRLPEDVASAQALVKRWDAKREAKAA